MRGLNLFNAETRRRGDDMREYRVLLPIDVEGHIYQFGSVVELDLETAKAYSHALLAVEEEAAAGSQKKDGEEK